MEGNQRMLLQSRCHHVGGFYWGGTQEHWAFLFITKLYLVTKSDICASTHMLWNDLGHTVSLTRIYFHFGGLTFFYHYSIFLSILLFDCDISGTAFNKSQTSNSPQLLQSSYCTYLIIFFIWFIFTWREKSHMFSDIYGSLWSSLAKDNEVTT